MHSDIPDHYTPLLAGWLYGRDRTDVRRDGAIGVCITMRPGPHASFLIDASPQHGRIYQGTKAQNSAPGEYKLARVVPVPESDCIMIKKNSSDR